MAGVEEGDGIEEGDLVLPEAPVRLDVVPDVVDKVRLHAEGSGRAVGGVRAAILEGREVDAVLEDRVVTAGLP